MSSRRRFLRDSTVMLGAAAFAPRQLMAQDRSPQFDFIVVGAGASGCVIANRLSADPHTRVLVVEAGGPIANPLIPVPGKWTSLLGSEVDWNYQVEPEPGLDNRAIRWPRGKAYGGSTAISAMALVRGHRLCFDAWARECGEAWSYASLLPYFRRIEDNSRGASDYHGAGGPLPVSDTTDPHAGHLAFLDGAREMGFAARRDWDFDGAQQEHGAGFYQKTIRGGRRHSAAVAYLNPVLSRPNLTVWSETQTLRVTLENRRATGVEVARAGRVEQVRATRAVILAAGVIATPKLLMLSGIGPAAALTGLGLPVVADLPGVGANLHDHPRVSLRWNALAPLRPSTVSAGLFTWSERGASARPPDIQFYVGRGLDVLDPFVTLTVALSQPQSRGSVTLRSTDPLAAPMIKANYFAEPADLRALAQGAQLARAIAETRPYAGIRGTAVDPSADTSTPQAWEAFVRRTADTIFHPVGTCRMGTGSDAVVDPQLRVRGVDNLRVADASIMPSTVNSQTMAACFVIGERAAEFVK